MTLYVVIQQPDGDWDHHASVDSVWDDEKLANIRRAYLAATSPDWPAETHKVTLNKRKETNMTMP